METGEMLSRKLNTIPIFGLNTFDLNPVCKSNIKLEKKALFGLKVQMSLDCKSSLIIVNQVLCLKRQTFIYSLHFFYINKLYSKCSTFLFFFLS